MKYIKNPNSKCNCSNWKHHATWVLNVDGIEKSVKTVIKSGSMDKLTKDAYQFINGLSGFIAHYDIHGFKAYYQDDIGSFYNDLRRSADLRDFNRYVSDSFFVESEQNRYYAQKADLCKRLRNLVGACI